MQTITNYTGCRVYIHDENGVDLASTVITEHNKDYMIITIPGLYSAPDNSGVVNVLILTDSGLHEYRGRLRKSVINPTSTEVLLFKGTVKKDYRAARRYTVNTEAVAQGLFMNASNAPFLDPLCVSLVNLSTSGALIKAEPNYFPMDAVIQLRLRLGEAMTTVYGQIVRIKDLGPSATEYGCKFISV